MNDLQFREYSTNSADYDQAIELRNDLLRKPLGLDLLSEDLADEANQWHFGLWRAEHLAASVTIKPISPDRVKLRQMCVAKSEQGSGLGSQLVQQVEIELLKRGVREVELAARVAVVPFYNRLGYQSVGEQFTEVTIPHQKMVKRLVN